jgi:predicted nucleotidyltransferase
MIEIIRHELSALFRIFVFMKSTAEILLFLAFNKQLFKDQYHIVRIGIFGSYARGEQEIDSDIDLLVEFEEHTENLYDLKKKLKAFFFEKFGIEVDICREKYIKPKFRNSILREAKYAY